MAYLHALDIPHLGLWRAIDFPNKDTLAVDLDPVQLQPVIDCARALTVVGRDVETVQASELPLGALAPVVSKLRQNLMNGRGIAVVRGFPIDRVSPEVLELVYWAIGLHLGTPVSQSVMGERLGHIRDVTDADPNARAYRNRNELTPHTDPGDILSFLCIQPARTGGISRFVSSLTIHEEIRNNRPDLLDELYQGFHYHRFGEQGPGRLPITPHRIPVYSHRNGRLSCRYVRQYIEMAADEDPNIVISELGREALEYLEAQAARSDLHVDFTLDVGEAIVANNFTVLHARSAFEDHSEPDRKRHLLRLWLAADPPRPLVPEILHYDGEPGIPAQPGQQPTYETDVEVN